MNGNGSASGTPHVAIIGGGPGGYAAAFMAANLSAVGVKVDHVPRLVEVATKDICHQTNPRPCTPADFERLFAAAF